MGKMNDVNFDLLNHFFSVALSFLLSSILCWLIVRSFNATPIAHFMLRDTHAKQAMHRRPTPRIGGVGIIVSFVAVVCANAVYFGNDIVAALVSGLVVFLVGLREDIYRDVSPKARLLAAFLSAVLALHLSDSMITHLDLPSDVALVAVPALWIVVTLVWSAGLCHALNLIDGLNGLASGYVIIASLTLSVVAAKAGQNDIALLCMILVGALGGFIVFNWPFGRIFLGDGGAYDLGHILAWLGIVLVSRDVNVSPLSLLLILFWPVTDTLFTISRRLIYKRAVDQPDRFHFHHIVVRVVSSVAKGRLSRTIINSLAAVTMYPIMFGPAFLGVVFWNNPKGALVSLVCCLFAFVVFYVLLVDLLAARRLRRRRSKYTMHVSETLPKIERSELSGIFVEGCLALDVSIIRLVPGGDWRLEAVTGQSRTRKWVGTFNSDLDAWHAFIETLADEGIDSMVGFSSRIEHAS